MEKRQIEDGIFRYENFILLFVSILLVTSLYFFVYPSWLMAILMNATYGEDIAKLEDYDQDVRWKHGSSFSWEKTSSNQSLFNGDFLFVGDNSSANISFNNGDQVVVNQNSLIRVTKSVAGGRVADLKFGDFRAKLKKGNSLKVRYAGTVKQIKAEEDLDFVIKKTDVSSQIYINKGKLKIDNSKETISEGVGVVVKEKAIEIKPLEKLEIKEVVEHQDMVEIVKPSKETEIAGQGEPKVQLENQPVKQKKQEDLWAFSTSLPEEEQKTPEDIAAEPQSVDVAMKLVDDVLSFLNLQSDEKEAQIPLGNFHIHHEKVVSEYETSTLEFTAKWRPVKGIKKYKVQVATDQGFKQVKFEKTVSEPKLHDKIKDISEDQVFFRVIPSEVKGRRPASIEFPISVDYKALPYLRAPTLQYPEDKTEFILSKPEKNLTFFFIWSPNDLAEKYQLEISRSKDFSRIEYNYTSDTNTLSVNDSIDFDSYYWRVRAMGEGQTSPWSKPNSWSFSNFVEFKE